MSKKPSDELFYLIKSMSQSEKRYFKRFSIRHSGEKENNYVKLFDAINRQKEYIEVALLQEPFVKHMHRMKSYLSELILDSLQEFNANSKLNYTTKNLIIQADILLGRGLYKQSRKLLKKARKIAEGAEDYSSLYDISSLDYRLAVLAQNIPYLENYPNVVVYEKNCLERHDNQLLFREAGTKILLSRLKNVFSSNSDGETDIEKLANSALFSSENNAKSLSAKRLYHTFLAMHFRAIGEYKKSYDHRNLLIAMFETNPLFLKAHFDTYVMEMFNFLLSLKEMKEYEEWEKRQNLLIALITDKKNEQKLNFILPKLLAQAWYLELDLYLETNRLSEAVVVVGRIENSQKKYAKYLTKADLAQLQYKIAYVWFCQKEFKKSLTYTNKIINELSGDARSDIGLFTRILNLLIHYEMEHYELLEYLTKQVGRYQKKVKLYPEFTQTVLNLIRDLISAPNDLTISKKTHKNYGAKFKVILSNKAESTVIYYLDVERWLCTRL